MLVIEYTDLGRGGAFDLRRRLLQLCGITLFIDVSLVYVVCAYLFEAFSVICIRMIFFFVLVFSLG